MPLADRNVDAVLCSLGLPFFPDKLAALREMHRVLTAGGRLAVNAVGPIPPMFTAMAEALTVMWDPKRVGSWSRCSRCTTERSSKSVTGAGFGDVVVRTRTLTLSLPAPNEFLWQYVRGTPLTGALEQVGTEERAAIEHEVVEARLRFVEDEGVAARPRALIATGGRE